MPASSPTTVIPDSSFSSSDEKSNGTKSNHASPCCGVEERTSSIPSPIPAPSTEKADIVRDGVRKEISKRVLRQKLGKLRHLVIEKGINPFYLDRLFPQMLQDFSPQTVNYNGGIAKVKEWKISCYLEVMEGGIPCTNPNLKLLELFRPLLDECNDLFLEWYRQQHACNTQSSRKDVQRSCKRLMTFLTRYTPAPGEQALLKHVDGAGKVDGSVVVALPIDRWSGPEEENSFVGHGGGLTFWDGKDPTSRTRRPREIHYETRSGDLAFIDRAVWHQADPITKGTRWALVIFYDVQTNEAPTKDIEVSQLKQ